REHDPRARHFSGPRARLSPLSFKNSLGRNSELDYYPAGRCGMQPSRLFLSYPDHRAPRTVLVISPANRIVSPELRISSPKVIRNGIERMTAMLPSERIERLRS